MEVEEFGSPDWKKALEAVGLSGFEALWDLDLPLFEPPNRRRGGTSSVARLTAAGIDTALFLKRQTDHASRSLVHPLRGEATAAREWRNLRALARLGLEVAEPVYFGLRRRDGRLRAILVTAEVRDARPLDDWLRERATASPGRRRPVLHALARAVRRLHDAGYRHGALYPKHLFVGERGEGHDPVIRWIDLESCRLTPFRRRAALRDLDALNRRTQGATRSDRMVFLKAYLGEPDKSRHRRRWVKALLGRSDRKAGRRSDRAGAETAGD